MLTPENERVFRVWHFCGGWKPELLQMAAHYHDARDLDFMCDQLMAMRDAIDAHYDEKRKK